MDEETGGLNIILICILLCILFFSYSAIPSEPLVKQKTAVSSKLKKERKFSKEDNTQTAEESLIEQETDQTVSDEKIDTEETPVITESKSESALDKIAVIPMNNPVYKTHKKGIVQFTHQKHIDSYKLECGQCHHDKNGKPLNLTASDTVQGCAQCHSGTQKQKGEALSDQQKIIKYHFEALHANCIGCHKSFNAQKGDPDGKGPAPISCAQCHPKK